MTFQNEKKILRIIKFAPPLFILLISIIVLTIQFIDKNAIFEKEKIKIQNEYLSNNKQLIKDRVNEVFNYIQQEKRSTESDLKESLQLAIQNAHAIATTIYENNKDKSPTAVKKLIIDALRNVRFNEGRGYYFIYDKKAINHLLPYNKELEGKSFLNHKDSKGTLIVQDMINLLKNKNEAFLQWYWFNPNNPDVQKRKIGLIKDFEPFNWIIGTGEYIEDFEKSLQNKLLRHIQNIRFGENGYIFIVNYDSTYLTTKKNNTKNINKVLNKLIDISKNGEGYYTYAQYKNIKDEQITNKTSFVKGLNDWSWMIGTGFYQKDMQKSILNKKNELDDTFKNNMVQTIQLSILLIFLLVLCSIYFSKILQERFEKYKKEIESHIKTNNDQQNLLSHQSKMAAMGEMIGNIAHQWRQPLSAISTTATGLRLQKELNILDEELLLKELDDINESVQYLSTTIDDFRNFFKVNKQKVNFDISSTIDKSITLVNAQLKNNNIKLIKDIEDVNISNFQNELIQVIINILNNSKDELLKKDKNFEKLIFIQTKISYENILITIKDNAGGIPHDIINRIFEPYFSTKHKSQGTGIGLYMSREIITKNMQGDIKAYNSIFKYNSCEYKGAVFEITLPLTNKD
jgi:signal transduction histidine kinase